MSMTGYFIRAESSLKSQKSALKYDPEVQVSGAPTNNDKVSQIIPESTDSLKPEGL